MASLLGAWGLDDAQVTEVPEGSVNTWYRVETAVGRFFLRVDERDDPRAVDTELCILDALRALPVPRVVPTRDGRWTTPLGTRPCLLFEALAGEAYPPPALTPLRLASLGALVAKMHETTVPPGLAEHRFAPQRVHDVLFLPVRDRTLAEHPKAARALDEVFREGWQPYAFPQLPRAIVHGDLFHDNVLYEGQRVSGLLDFEAAGEGPRLFDLAVAVHALCFDPVAQRFATERVRAFVNGYHSQLALTKAEHDAWPAMLRYAAARFLVTRLRDFEYRPDARQAGTWKDYRDYLHHLQALDRPPPLTAP
jgi:homoserine kinase type II